MIIPDLLSWGKNLKKNDQKGEVQVNVSNFPPQRPIIPIQFNDQYQNIHYIINHQHAANSNSWKP